ncbi:hypothetical protein HYDPIDRAFT_186930 [Hydnomerulius pinastri MD-312]|nr:hypothetical protein HYDPIDRAFT_186930 [Hydnomerulius pinastri MD-312]
MTPYCEGLEQSGEEARVEVNQRALIDKVLSRYSGEFTCGSHIVHTRSIVVHTVFIVSVFRELLQNSDDAGSSTVEIHFETAAYQGRAKEENTGPPMLPDLKSTHVIQWTFRNNGKPFEGKDWERLPRIAEGNPSPEKIGAFGVGFYSLFSVTESPCVSSGGYGMRFYWKKNDNQLYVRRGSLSQKKTPDPWTTFEMPLREPGPMPPALDFMRFLASSITFMVNLRDVVVFFDDYHIGHIKKSSEPPRSINVPVEMERSSPENIMHVKEVQCHRVTIEAEVMDAVYACSRVKNPSSLETVESREKQQLRDVSKVDLAVFTAEVDVTVDEKISGELERCMKKKPPSQLKYSLIYTGKDEYDRSSVEQQRNHHLEGASIFRGLRADLKGAKHTRIFIGHATGQTTSIGGHMASHFIPTVERESIDLADSNVAIWNKELLYVGGFLSRVVYELELSDIQHLWEEAATGTPDSRLSPVYELELSDIQRLWEEAATGTPDSRPSPASRDHLHRRFLHVLKFFTFHHSTPSPKVAQMLRNSFYECSASLLRLLSSVGVRAAPNIRAFDPEVAKFLKSLPMLSEHVSLEAVRSIETLPGPHKISPITIKDVLQALDGHPLSEEELVACLRWWSSLKRNDSSLSAAELLNVAALNGTGGTAHSLSSREYFIDPEGLGAHIPPDGPLPASLIPLNISRHFTRAELMNLGWREFTIIDWFQYISRTDVMSEDPIYDFTKSPNWAERVLHTLSRVWSSLSDEMRRAAKTVFADNRCVPTSHGLRLPEGSYLPGANDTLFRKLGLPVVTFTSGFEFEGEVGTLLSFIGVRTHVPLELISNRLLDTGDWSISDFIDYLVRSSPPLTTQQISILKSSKLFSEESPQNSAGKKPRYCADELFPPVEIFRQLQLPVIDWGKKSKWLNESDEAELLYRLGLRPYPPLEIIIELCSSPDTSVRATAFKYFCYNLRSKYSRFNPENFQDVEFIPAENKEGTCLKRPGDVFLGTQWKAFGFSIVQVAYQKVIISELGIQQHPPPSMLLHWLETTRLPDEETARQRYECLSECIQSFTQPELTRLSELQIVPTSSSGAREWLAPAQCYLGPSTDEFHSNLFVFVDFGAKANRFLSACGSRKEPSVKDIAESLIHGPDRFYNLAGGHEGFLEKLRDLAARRTHIPNDTLNRMSSQRTLLGERRERADDQVGWKHVYELRTPKEIVIVDDSRDYALFSDAIFVAPQDESLERFYSSIGCRRLSTIVQERYEDSLEIPDTETCSEVQTLVLQRLPLFLQKCPHAQYDKGRVPSPDNFSVAVCEKLLVHKTLIIGDDSTPRKQDLWATTKYNKDEGKIELWLSRHAKRDMYDLAASLCRLLFGTVKVNHTLLLGAMLSDFELLKRAGFDVDQISKQQPSELRMDKSTKGGSIAPGDSHSSTNLTAKQGSPPQSALEYIRHSIADTLNSTRDAYHVVKGRLISSPQPSTTSEKAVSLPSSWTPRQVIPQSYIRNIVNKATEACNSGGTRLLDDEDDVIQFLKHHSCNDFGQVRNLRSLGTWENVEVHVAEGLSEINTFMAGKQEPLARFIRIITPAASAHNLPMRSLHIFYDVGEGPIAFNREGSLYLNLRYFEEWHDEDVKNGNLQRAQLSWFFALAHEIAHNLIPSHDSAHEFWFSAICEAHIGDFFAAPVVSDA